MTPKASLLKIESPFYVVFFRRSQAIEQKTGNNRIDCNGSKGQNRLTFYPLGKWKKSMNPTFIPQKTLGCTDPPHSIESSDASSFPCHPLSRFKGAKVGRSKLQRSQDGKEKGLKFFVSRLVLDVVKVMYLIPSFKTKFKAIQVPVIVPGTFFCGWYNVCQCTHSSWIPVMIIWIAWYFILVSDYASFGSQSPKAIIRYAKVKKHDCRHGKGASVFSLFWFLFLGLFYLVSFVFDFFLSLFFLFLFLLFFLFFLVIHNMPFEQRFGHGKTQGNLAQL